jgi:5-(carboxyamino)imidazole ribonucleotide synthase
MINTQVFLPGSLIGVFGSGQLGRMLGLAARPMGYRFAVYGPEPNSPAGQVADFEVVAAYTDEAAVRDFTHRVDIVTFEFENVPSSVAEIARRVGVPVRPGGGVLHIAQQRVREKQWLRNNGVPTPRFVEVNSLSSLQEGLQATGLPAILKSAAFGYDGKGQVRIESDADAPASWAALGASSAVVEEFVDFATEVSVIVARAADGAMVDYGVIENHHRNGILDLSVAPGRVSNSVLRQAVQIARQVAESIGLVGILCVELFVSKDDRVLVNEIAPRPHNSGHLTIEAAATSQFEQQVRSVCGLTLGCTNMGKAAAMANLLGDLWQAREPNWQAALRIPGVKLHLYGKREARPGRKMGHLTALADDVYTAEAMVLEARTALRR